MWPSRHFCTKKTTRVSHDTTTEGHMTRGAEEENSIITPGVQWSNGTLVLSVLLHRSPSSGGPVNIQLSHNGRRRLLSYCESPASRPAQEKPFTSNGAVKSVQDWSKVTWRYQQMPPLGFCTEQSGGVKTDWAPRRTLETGQNWLQGKRTRPRASLRVHAKGLAFIQRGRTPSLKANQISSLHTSVPPSRKQTKIKR